MKSNYFIITLCILFFESCTQVEISQWRGPERNGIYPEKNLLTSWPEGGPQLLWKFENLGNGYSSPVAFSNKVYIMGSIDTINYIFIFDLNGKLLIKKSLGRDYARDEYLGIKSTPTIYEGFGYVVTGIGELYCFNAENGDVIWNKNLIKEFYGNQKLSGFLDNLIIDNDKLICSPGGVENSVIALDRKTGKLIWTCPVNNARQTYYSPILYQFNGKKYVVYQVGSSIVSIDSENGSIAWRYDKQNHIIGNHITPIYLDGFIFLNDEPNCIKLKIAENGLSVSEVWKSFDIRSQLNSSILLEDRLYGAGINKALYCTDWNTGEVIYKWVYKDDFLVLLSAENLLYGYSYNGVVYLIKPLNDRFEILGHFQVFGGRKEHCSYPVIKYGKLFIRHDNSLFVYNISK